MVGDDCYRVEVRSLEKGPPTTGHGTLGQQEDPHSCSITTQIPIPGGFTTLTENYEFTNGQPSPVMGPLTALPVDLPLFRGGQAKGLEKFSYEANVRPRGHEGPGRPWFLE